MNYVFELFAKLGMDKSEYDEGLDDAGKKGESFGSKLAKGLGSAAKIATGLITTASTAASAFAGSALKTGQEFDSSMSQIAATLGFTTQDIAENVNGAGDAFQALRDKAQEMGAATNFTAKEAAEGLNILAMSGFDATESIGMIEDVLHLSAAGAMDMASAAGYISGAMKGFADDTKDAQYYADLMAKGATLANTSVAQLGEAMSSGAAGAAAYGQSADSMTVSLLRLAEQGEVGAAAGTALSAAMKNLYTPTDQAKAALQELGVAAYDETGTAREFNTVVDELSAALSGMSAEEANAYKQTIFGIQGLDAYNKMTVTGVEKQQEWAKALANASVNIDQVAAAMEATGAVIGNTNTNFADLADEMVWNFDRLGGDAEAFSEEMRDYLHFEYDMSYEDAEKAIKEFTSVMETQTGEAAKQYATMTDNLQGDMDILSSSLDGLKMVVADTLMPTAREFVQFGSTALSAITEGFKEGGIDGAMDAIGEMLSQGLSMIVEKVPAVFEVGVKLIGALGQGIMDAVPLLLTSASQIIQMLVEGMSDQESIQSMVDGAVDIIMQLADFIVQNGPLLIQAAVQLIITLATALTNPENIGNLVDGAIAVILALTDAIIDAIPELIRAAPAIIDNLVTAIMENLPKIVAMGIKLVLQLVEGIIKSLAEVISAAVQIVMSLVDGIGKNFQAIIDVGKQMVDKVKEGFHKKVDEAKQWGKDLIQNFIGGIKEKWENLKSTISNVAGTIKNLLGFSEPKEGPLRNFHTFAPDMMELYAKGIRDNKDLVMDEISGLAGDVKVGLNSGEVGGSSPIHIVVQSVLDGKIIAESTMKYQRGKAMAMGV